MGTLPDSGEAAGRHAARERLDRDHRLLARYRASGGAQWDRDAVVTRFLPLARQLAVRYTRPPEPFDDVYQVACMALVKAVDRYDAQRHVAFSSYAVPTIVGEIKRHYRDRTWGLHVPRDLAELALRVRRAGVELSSRTGNTASVDEIAAALGIGEEDVRQARAAMSARTPASMDAGAQDHDDEPGAPGIEKRRGAEDPGFERAEQRTMLAGLLRYLPPRDRKVVYLYYNGDLTQDEIGERLSISQMQVLRILKRSMERLSELPPELADIAPVSAAA